MFQFCDEQGIGLGGGVHRGRFGMYIGDNLHRGSSERTECFNNECLASGPDFECIDMEVWGFE